MSELILLSDPWWPLAALAVIVFVDATISIRPVRVVRDCLVSVNFPLEWGWILVVIKYLAVAGLISGIWIPGVAAATLVALFCYFCCAVVAHVRARALGSMLWVNCLGMIALTVAAGAISFAHLII